MTGTIYLVTNLINGAKYVGKTKKDCEKRLHEHILAANRGVLQTRLARAIRKYGHVNFIVDVLEKPVIDHLDIRERHFIKMIKPEYNMTEGGDGGAQITEEIRKVLSDLGKTRTGAKNSFFKKHHTSAAKKKMSEYRMGKVTPPEVVKKLSEASSRVLSKQYVVIDPEGVEHQVNGLKTFCKKRGLVYTSLHATIKSCKPTNGAFPGWLVKRP